MSAPKANHERSEASAAGWLRARRLVWDIAIPLLIFIVAWLPRYALIHSLDLVTDEAVYIPVGIHDVRLLQTGAYTNIAWLVNFEAPAFPKLLIGLGALTVGPLLGPQGWLIGARLPGVLLAALTLVAAYFLARDIVGRGGAALGALALAVSPWLAFYGAIAYLDGYMLCFATLAVRLAWHAARRPWLWPLVGLLGGLAFASKYTAASIATPILLYLAVRSLAVTRRLPPWQALLMPLVGLLTVYLVDPAIWVSPLTRFWHSVMFEYHHAAHGHEVFWAGSVWQHVPPGLGLYIALAKLSLFITVPAALGLVWGLWRIARALLTRQRFTPLDERVAFLVAWLGGLIPFFASLTIIVGAHYVLPLAPPLAFAAGWAWMRAARWLAPRLTPRAQAALTALRGRVPGRPRLAARLALEPSQIRRGVA
ncbi:MAG: glycosyltransferase family 39 protein, partial [Chloroflexota bacterium]|nr:glycosyltransferase family 39 protein [Chloroflexota bacterium]